MTAQASTFRPRQHRDHSRGVLVAAQVRAAGGSAMDAALAAIDATFGPAAVINNLKYRAERLIRMSFGHSEVRARFRFYVELIAARGIDLNEACAILRDECASKSNLPLTKMIRAELYLILRWMRAQGMHAAFAETVAAMRPNGPARVVAATSIVGGELVVCEGDANGGVIARFPRTETGHRAALALMEAE